jgi:hypothetical protein
MQLHSSIFDSTTDMWSAGLAVVRFGTIREAIARSRPTGPAEAASEDPTVRPVLLRRGDRRLPLAGQVLEAAGVEQRLVELAPLGRVHLGHGG